MVLTAACATEKPVSSTRYFWPRLPDRPRIEWLNTYSSQLDLDKTDRQRFLELLVGEDAPVLFRQPVAIRSDGKQRAFIADIGLRQVKIFDFGALEVRTLSPPATHSKKTIIPISLALDAAGNIYVLDANSGLIFVYDPAEKFLREIEVQLKNWRPVDIVVDSTRNRIIIADGYQHSIHLADLSGVVLKTFGGFGKKTGEFNKPISVCVNSKGEIIVADAYNARVQVFDAEGVYLRRFGQRGTGLGNFQLIKSVAVDSDDNIYVSDGKSNSVSIYSSRGDLLLVFGGFFSGISDTKAPGGFLVPMGIDVDKRDRIFIADMMNRRFQVFQYISDAFLLQNPIPGIVAN